VRAHEVEFARVVVVTGHEEVALVLVGGRVGGRWLRGRRQPLEVELVGVPLAMHFGHYVLIVVVSETQEHADSLFNGPLPFLTHTLLYYIYVAVIRRVESGFPREEMKFVCRSRN
jgi:hypothetical protein